jgi:hypothetical protein
MDVAAALFAFTSKPCGGKIKGAFSASGYAPFLCGCDQMKETFGDLDRASQLKRFPVGAHGTPLIV